MAKVILKNGWNSPWGFYRPSPSRLGPPVDIPDSVIYDKDGKSRLPSTAKIVDEDYVTPEPKRVSADTFSEHQKMLSAYDPDRAAAESQARAVEESEKTLAENAAKHQADLVAEAKEETPKRGPGRPRKGNTNA